MTPGDVVLYEAGLPGRGRRVVWGAVLAVDGDQLRVAGFTLRPKHPDGTATVPLQFRGGGRATFAFGPPEVRLRHSDVVSVVATLDAVDWAAVCRAHGYSTDSA